MRVFLFLLLIGVYSAITTASTHNPKLQGYLHFPTDLDYWENSPTERLIAKALLMPVDINLYNYPENDAFPDRVVPDLESLTLSSLEYSTATTVNVYEKRNGWLLVKTNDNQMLWMKNESPENYESLQRRLQSNWYINTNTDEVLRTDPNLNANKIEALNLGRNGYAMVIVERKLINDELWLRLQAEPNSNDIENTHEKIEFDNQHPKGWLKAHDVNGELTFELVGGC